MTMCKGKMRECLRIDKETFQEIEEKALRKKEQYDYFHISSTAAMISLPEYGRSRPKNAFIYVLMGANFLEWDISNFQPKKCPGTFTFCVKNTWNIAISVGESEENTAYFHFKDMAEKEPLDFLAVGAIETEEFAYAFCFDWKKKRNYYIAADRDATEGSDLFIIINAVKDFPLRKELSDEHNYTTQDSWASQRI